MASSAIPEISTPTPMGIPTVFSRSARHGVLPLSLRRPGWSVFYQTTTGGCVAAGTPGAAFKLGVTQELKIVDARGLVLDATLWIPGEALNAVACTSTACSAAATPSLTDIDSSKRLPGVVFSDGLSSRQDTTTGRDAHGPRGLHRPHLRSGRARAIRGHVDRPLGIFDMHRAAVSLRRMS